MSKRNGFYSKERNRKQLKEIIGLPYLLSFSHFPSFPSAKPLITSINIIALQKLCTETKQRFSQHAISFPPKRPYYFVEKKATRKYNKKDPPTGYF
ncbi:hypothetical protein CDAR_242211 [Caerostris darwini]|uniref:Uncharacterized protein n=1 Tax=Caerostris darwini TaxID=1538125 RepID=A0AAV4NM03_9ARAC|nr:hypothetical protein CDAR_242211 [Caerostris darwini]